MTIGRHLWPSRTDRPTRLLVAAGLVLFVVAVYAVVVLAGGVLMGHTASPHVGLSVLATAVVALCVEPLQRRLERWASRITHGERPSPYDVLRQFSGSALVEGADDVVHRMARLLAEGTGAQWAQVWLFVRGELVLAATFPDHAGVDADRAPPGATAPVGRRSHSVVQGGEALGLLQLQEDLSHPLTPVEERLFAGLATGAGPVLHGVRLRAELAQRVRDLSARANELRRSRERLVESQDAGRRQLERDIHDGAQQQLVALAVNLRLAQTLAGRAPDRARQVLVEQMVAARTTVDTLVDLSRGIYPRLLVQQGIGAALRAAFASSALAITTTDEGVGRHDADLEAAIYFCCLEAVQNAAKHADATRVDVALRDVGQRFEFDISDDGRGFDPDLSSPGLGRANMTGRVDALGGQVAWESRRASGTKVTGWVPIRRLPERSVG